VTQFNPIRFSAVGVLNVDGSGPSLLLPIVSVATGTHQIGSRQPAIGVHAGTVCCRRVGPSVAGAVRRGPPRTDQQGEVEAAWLCVHGCQTLQNLGRMMV
jgi:hypothetical protein